MDTMDNMDNIDALVGKTKEEGRSRVTLFILIAIAALLILGALLVEWLPLSGVERRQAALEKEKAKGRAEQYRMATNEVSAQLKSPASARFAPMAEVKWVDGGYYTASGWVDSQNAFGAMLRSEWSVDFFSGDSTQVMNVHVKTRE